MNNPESALENKTYKLLWDFEIQTDHFILARRPDLLIVKKKKKKEKKKRTCKTVDFVVPADHRIKLKESEKRGKYLYLARDQKRTMGHGGDGDTKCNKCTWSNPQKDW